MKKIQIISDKNKKSQEIKKKVVRELTKAKTLGNQKTIDRIQYLLLNNKPLRN